MTIENWDSFTEYWSKYSSAEVELKWKTIELFNDNGKQATCPNVQWDFFINMYIRARAPIN